jgi:hypothetical protein
VVLVLVVIILFLQGIVVGRGPELLVDFKHFGLAVVTNQAGICRDDMAFFENNLAGVRQLSL